MITGLRYNTLGRIIGLAVVACFAYAALLFMQQQTFFKMAVETEGTVTHAGGALFGNNQVIQVDYMLNGVAPISARISAHFHHAKGQTVRIAYHPRHPSEARLTEPFDVYLDTISIFMLGLIVLVADIVRRILKRGIPIPVPDHRTNITRSLRVEYPDPVTGERRVAHSENELPTDICAKLRTAQHQATAEGIHKIRKQTYTFTDASGRQQTYHSLEEMPPDLRRRAEQEMRKHSNNR